MPDNLKLAIVSLSKERYASLSDLFPMITLYFIYIVILLTEPCC